MARLLEQYRKEVLPKLKEFTGRGNPMSLPKLEKLSLNMGLGKAIQDSKIVDSAVKELATICGQAPMVTQSRVAVSNFHLREGYRIGCMVTLRNRMMYEFMDRLINTAIPRIRDFRGLNPNSFDRQGNYSMGVEEITIFPEINADRMEYPLGMDITFVVRNSQSADESRELLRLLGMPFRRQGA